MKCPVCKRELHEYNAESFRVDICRDGCSGIWFDSGEFEKCNQNNEPFPAELLRVRKISDVVIDRVKERTCPRCTDSPMTKTVMDYDFEVEIDSCPKCHGHWLDIGELEHLRNEDQENSAIANRIAAWHKRIDEQMKSVDTAHKVKAFIKVIFGNRN